MEDLRLTLCPLVAMKLVGVSLSSHRVGMAASRTLEEGRECQNDGGLPGCVMRVSATRPGRAQQFDRTMCAQCNVVPVPGRLVP
jgi:hypothetical protein